MSEQVTLPPRRVEPLLRVKSYVERRIGAIDPAQQQRRLRTATQAIRR